MNITFENDYQHKIMTQAFAEATSLEKSADVLAWRQAWMKALSSWHSPYKALIDCRNLTIGADPEVASALALMIKFFNGFFLKSVAGYGEGADRGYTRLPFTVHPSLDEAAKALNIRTPKDRDVTDLRSAIQLENRFQQHTVELTFAAPVTLRSKEDVAILRSKLTNNLMQWHSKWSLIVDCANLDVAPDALSELDRTLLVLRGFFMKAAVGYGAKASAGTYPFPVYRARHRAVAEIEGEGNFSGDKADCKSRKQSPVATPDDPEAEG